MPMFPSEDWLAALQVTLNDDEVFQQAAAGWEASFLFTVEPEGPVSEPRHLYVEIDDGKCPAVQAVGSAEEAQADFVVSGGYEAWKKVVQGKLDPVAAIMTRKLRLKGDMSQVMSHMKAVKGLVAATTKVDTEFPDG